MPMPLRDWQSVNVCSGSQATVQRCPRYFRFAPELGHCPINSALRICAMCGRLRVGKCFHHVRRLGSVQPCVRPVGAVHMTAGHNALRGSGPGQKPKPAFDNALAQVGCPDRRIDRLCITCCSSSQPSTSRRLSGAISFTPQARRVACNARPWPSWPRPCAQSCWQVQWRRPSSGAAPTTP